MRQGDLFAPGPYVRPTATPGQRRLEAAAFVRWRRRSSVCGECCDDRWWRLCFVHREVDDGNVPIAHLVVQGASRAVIERELRKCVVLCRRCLLALSRPKMLRTWGRAPVGIAGTYQTTSPGGRKGVELAVACHVVKRR